MVIDDNIKFRSQTYGELTLSEVCDKLLEFYENHKTNVSTIEIAIGSDSQTKAETKMVSVIVIYAEGKGGISFNLVEKLPAINSVREKLEIETGRSLVIATNLIDIFETTDKYYNMYLNCPVSIHIDAGNSPKGKTKDLVNFVTGWVRATGFNCTIKPDSYAASSVADKISK